MANYPKIIPVTPSYLEHWASGWETLIQLALYISNADISKYLSHQRIQTNFLFLFTFGLNLFYLYKHKCI